ncbi:MAG: TDP-N-acetylfucosamine:lipid II N-acetylfucosaminyltransferase [Anaerolineaceae bacterium]|nr:TDP-N-acetylfucosamine:lipid II N-acetylfucosaminyltransferase [Anaerolineaceae bacterium]
MSLKLLHIINDEKFLDGAFDQFEEILPGASTYLLPNKSKPIKYLKKIKPIRVLKLSFLNPAFIRALGDYDAVILHSMTTFAIELISRADVNTNFVWIGMGSDYYPLIYPDRLDMLEEETAKIVKVILPEFGTIGARKPNNRIITTLKSIIRPNYEHKNERIQRVNIFCPVLPIESELIKKQLGKFSPKTVPWNYGSNTSFFDNTSAAPSCLSGKNILVGNSASPTNNHIDIFKKLKDAKVPKESKIIVPLSYGSAEYRKIVIESGLEILGAQFEPITDFMDIAEYLKLLQGCSTVVMNHIRQEGAGNISLGLYFGAKIFLNPKSPIYQSYTDAGARVFSTESLYHALSQSSYNLTDEDITVNREFVIKTYGKTAILSKTRNLIREIENLTTPASFTSL